MALARCFVCGTPVREVKHSELGYRSRALKYGVGHLGCCGRIARFRLAVEIHGRAERSRHLRVAGARRRERAGQLLVERGIDGDAHAGERGLHRNAFRLCEPKLLRVDTGFALEDETSVGLIRHKGQHRRTLAGCGKYEVHSMPRVLLADSQAPGNGGDIKTVPCVVQGRDDGHELPCLLETTLAACSLSAISHERQPPPAWYAKPLQALEEKGA